MGRDRDKYIHNLARTMVGRLKIADEDLCPQNFDPHDLARPLSQKYGRRMEEIVAEWSPETRGRILAAGCGAGNLLDQTPMSAVTSYFYCSGSDNGKRLLTRLATAVIFAAIVDNAFAATKARSAAQAGG